MFKHLNEVVILKEPRDVYYWEVTELMGEQGATDGGGGGGQQPSPQQTWPQVTFGCCTSQQHWHAETKTECKVKLSQKTTHEDDVNMPTPTGTRQDDAHCLTKHD